MNDEPKDDELKDRFDRMGEALKGRFEMTKPGTEPIKDAAKPQDRNDKD